MNMTGQRAVAFLILLVAGIFSLPGAAFFLDSPGMENWIIPIQLIVHALIGALVGRLLPGMAGADPSANRAMLFGAVTGVVLALLGIVIFFLLLNGFSGA
ncbi:MAG: hypothetical protein ACR2ME_05560 [Acidimicrobiia bacterium]